MCKICRVVLIAGIGLALAHCTDAERSPQTQGQTDSAGDSANAESADARTDRSFAELDLDGDGFLSREETRQVPALGGIFSLADRDQDDRLNVPEFSHATLEGTKVSAEAAGGPLFLALDIDENGRITPEEAQAVPQLEANFSTFDVDGDGHLDEDEYHEASDEGLTPD